LNSRVLNKLSDLSSVFAVFFIPLLFFIKSRDQFELPKLTLIALLAVPLSLAILKKRASSPRSSLSWALPALFIAQALASLPATSLSWQTSLLGDYDNFSGLTTLATYLVWFACLSSLLDEGKIRKLFYFNSLAALFSALYAIGQHFQFDFIQWNPESVNATREFAALGNPNFLAAYLALSLPLFLCVSMRPLILNEPGTPPPRPWILFLASFGFFLILLGTSKGLALLGLAPMHGWGTLARTFGLVFFSIACVRLSLFQYWPTTLIGLTILGLGLFSTASRAGFLGALLGTLLWAFLIARKKEWAPAWRGMARQPGLLLYASLGLALSILALGLFGRPFLSRLIDSVAHVGQSLAVSRLHIWGPAVEMVKSNPLFGVGLDNFKIAFPFYSGVEFNQIDGMFVSSRAAHNELLQMAATTGLLGLAAYLSVIFAFGFLWWKSWRSSPPSAQWLLAAILSSAVAYHVQNFFSFGVSTINLVWFLLLACVHTLSPKPSNTEASPSRTPSLFSFLKKTSLALFILFALLFPLSRLAADIGFGQGTMASEILKRADSKTLPSTRTRYSNFQIYCLGRAVALCPWDVKYRLYLGLAYEQRAQIDPEHSKDFYREALDSYAESARRSPANAYYHNNIGRVYAHLGQQALAEEAYGKAVRLAPASPFFLICWAHSLRDIGKEPEAEAQIQKAARLSPAFTSNVIYQMAQQEYGAGNKKKAFQYAEEALRANSSNAEAYYNRGVLYLQEKEKKKAIADFVKADSFHPTAGRNPSIRSLNLLIGQTASELYDAGDKKSAFQYLGEALKANSLNAETYYFRGILYLSEKNRKKALADFEEVKKLQSDPTEHPAIRSLDQLIEQAKTGS
jgi:tetratricopeptide (TPR) repeat protein